MFCKYCGKKIGENETHVCDKKPELRWKDSVLNFFKEPIDVLKETYGDGNEKEKFYFGAVYLGVLFLSILLFGVKGLEFSDALVTALGITLLFATIKGAYAFFLFLFVKSMGIHYKQILSQVCLASLPQTLCILGMVLSATLGFYVGVLVLMVVYLIINLTLDMVLMEIIFQEKRNLGYWLYIGFCAVVTCVLYFILRAVLESVLNSIWGGMWN